MYDVSCAIESCVVFFSGCRVVLWEMFLEVEYRRYASDCSGMELGFGRGSAGSYCTSR